MERKIATLKEYRLEIASQEEKRLRFEQEEWMRIVKKQILHEINKVGEEIRQLVDAIESGKRPKVPFNLEKDGSETIKILLAPLVEGTNIEILEEDISDWVRNRWNYLKIEVCLYDRIDISPFLTIKYSVPEE